MRRQYHFWHSKRGLLAWDVDRLVALAKDLPRMSLPLSSIAELDEVHWFDDAQERPTCRRVIDHMRLVEEADLAYPIILAADGRVMDGMHRVAKAVIAGLQEIEAVRFETNPDPDYVDRKPSELPY